MMIEFEKPQQARFTGEVVELLERNGKNIARISIDPCILELSASALQDIHLGDQVYLEVHVTVNSVEPVFNTTRPR